jgi:hypothetical protein
MMRHSRNQDKVRFYTALNSNENLGAENRRVNWKFPEHPKLHEIKCFEKLKVKYVDSPGQLPESRYGVKRLVVHPDPLSVLFGEFESDGQPFPAGFIDWDDGFVDIAWRITFSVRPMLSSHVLHDWSKIIVQVSAIGREIFGDAVGEVTPEIESAWRQCVYARLEIIGK